MSTREAQTQAGTVCASRSLGPLPAGGRVVVVSPHLDDAALSLGATIARAADRGTDVIVATVFAGDPESERPAGPWDRECGFATFGEATRARRAEDVRACAILGATPVWLPFDDEQYADERDVQAVREALAPTLAEADTVLVPGSPLAHADHAWLARALLAHPGGERLALYAEQPYASEVTFRSGRSLRSAVATVRRALRTYARRGALGRPALSIADVAPPDLAWVGVRPTRAEWRRKELAIRAYGSQIEALGGRLLTRIRLHEAAAGGELVGLPTAAARRGLS